MVENGTTNCKWDTIIPFAPLWEAYKRVIKPNGAIVLFGSQPFTSALVMSNPKMFRDEWVWQKNRATRHLDAKKRPLKSHENIIVFGLKQPVYFPQKSAGHKITNTRHNGIGNLKKILEGRIEKSVYSPSTFRFPQSVQAFSVEAGKHGGLHPTQKPVALFEYLIKTYSNPGDLVLDNCIGSGTTAAACISTSRHYIGIEQNDEYFKVAVNRVRTTLPTLLTCME